MPSAEVLGAYLLAYVISVAVNWVLLVPVMLLVQRVADISIPERPTLLWQVAVIAAVGSALDLIPYVGWLAAWVAFYALMRKWFDATFWSVFVVWAAMKLITMVVAFLLVGVMIWAR